MKEAIFKELFETVKVSKEAFSKRRPRNEIGFLVCNIVMGAAAVGMTVYSYKIGFDEAKISDLNLIEDLCTQLGGISE